MLFSVNCGVYPAIYRKFETLSIQGEITWIKKLVD